MFNGMMNRSLRLFKLGGIPVSVDWGLLLIGVVFVIGLHRQVLSQFDPTSPWWPRGGIAVATVFVFFTCVLAHEWGHATFARRAGINVSGITLSFYGGTAILDGQAPTPADEFKIAVAGPGANLLLGCAFSAAAWTQRSFGWDNPILFGAIVWLAGVNFLLVLLNLIPVAPLDGGRVLTSVIWWRSGQAETARILSARAGLIAGALLVVFALIRFAWSPLEALVAAFVAAFVIVGARRELETAFIRRRLHSTSVAEIMTPRPEPVADSTTVERLLAIHGFAVEGRVVPITRWDRKPIGWLPVDRATALSEAERSWTTVGELMIPAEQVVRVWADQSVDELMEAVEADGDSTFHRAQGRPAVVVHGRDGGEIGTVGSANFRPLLHRPDFWGRRVADSGSTDEPSLPQAGQAVHR